MPSVAITLSNPRFTDQSARLWTKNLRCNGRTRRDLPVHRLGLSTPRRPSAVGRRSAPPRW